MLHLHLLNLMGALSWDPQIRGLLIVVVVVVMLPGTIYLLLATNVGARLGFLLAIAGLSGWLMLLGITWAFYGQGIKGRDPSWKVQEVVHSMSKNDLSAGSLPALQNFPKSGWDELPLTGSPMLGDAIAAVDNFITKSGRKPKIGPEGPIVKEPTAEELRFKAEFSESSDYIVIDGYTKGGNNCLGGTTATGIVCTSQLPKKILFWRVQHDFYLRHSPHYVAVELRPVVKQEVAADGAPPKPLPDNSKPITTVIVKRDLGSIRFPQVMMSIGSAIIFAVTCHALHRRDKQLMAMRAAGTTPVTA